ncbi:hypothetical protein ACP70R_039936 [Stipagrostis hirtigluma subsp. patula]
MHVNILEKADSLDGESEVVCDYCNRTFCGSYSTAETHFLKACEGVSSTIRAQVRKEFLASKNANARTMPTHVLLRQSAASCYSGGMSGNALVQSKKRKRTTTVDEDHCMEIRDHLDVVIARMFYSSDIPDCTNRLSSNLARNPYYHSSISIASMIHIPGYVPPGPKKLMTTLLQQERAHIEGLLETVKSSWKKAGVTIVCDGWSDVEKRPVINILAVTNSGPVFVGAINNENDVKRKERIAERLIAVIEDVGPGFWKYNVDQAQIVRKKLLDDSWWNQVEYILEFTEPVYSMIRIVDTEKSCLHLIYEMWNDMTMKVKAAIYKHEGKVTEEDSTFYSIVHGILVDWWSKSKSPLHCLAHSLNPRYYSVNWIDEDANRLPQHRHIEISKERNSCMKKLFPPDDLITIKTEYAEFALLGARFGLDSWTDWDILEPKTWWVTHGASVPKLQNLALKLLFQPASSSCYERNWSTYSLICKIMKSKHRPKWANDLVFVHTNPRLLSRASEYYLTDPESRLWDVGGDDPIFLASVLEYANFSLDEPEFELPMLEDDHSGEDNKMAIVKA